MVYFPYGHYLITTPLTVPSGITLLGECTFGMYPGGHGGWPGADDRALRRQ